MAHGYEDGTPVDLHHLAAELETPAEPTPAIARLAALVRELANHAYWAEARTGNNPENLAALRWITEEADGLCRPKPATYPVQAFQSIWHEAADAIAAAAVDDVDADWMLEIADATSGPTQPIDLSLTIHFADGAQADLARRYARRAVDRRDRNE